MSRFSLNLSCALGWLFASLFSPVAALDNPAIVFNQSDVPPGGTPPKTDPGVDRDPCPELKIPLRAIAPSDLRKAGGTETMVWGQTTREYPEFWFNIPYSPDIIDSASLVILDRERYILAPEQPIAIATTPGMIRVVSPIPLERDRWYQAHLKIKVYCRPGAPAESLSISANVYRIAPPAGFSEALNRAMTPVEKARVYAQYGLWYDLLGALSQLESQEFKPERDRLFDAVELSKFKEQPLVSCCLAPIQ